MRGLLRAVAAILLLLAWVAGLRADETADKVAEQKKAAQENWGLLDIGDPAAHETANLLIYAPKALEGRVKEWGGTLEKHYGTARKALQVDKDDKWWAGKLTVYLFAERDQFSAFARRVEKRRLDADDLGTFAVDDNLSHVTACPPRTKQDPPVEIQAGQQIAAAVLQRKAGAKTSVPNWLLDGFGRATYYRAVGGPPAASDRSLAAKYVAANKRSAGDVWGTGLEAEEGPVLRASLADFLAYGPGASKFPAVVTGFRPGENQDMRTTGQALEAANLKLDAIDKAWQAWALRPR
jgi:hypothetical protein